MNTQEHAKGGKGYFLLFIRNRRKDSADQMHQVRITLIAKRWQCLTIGGILVILVIVIIITDNVL